MNAAKFCILSVLGFYWTIANESVAREVLFYKVSRNYDSEGQLGKVYRQEFETRMFVHSTWHQRLYYHPYEPDVDKTLEIYSNADGSTWLSYRRAAPSLTEIVFAHTSLHAKFDLKRKLDGVHITKREVALPADVAKEIGLLWRAMLSGLAKDPDPTARVVVPHAPSVIAFWREDDSVETGMVAMVAYNAPNYRAFMNIVEDLIKISRSRDPKDPIAMRLPNKIRALRVKFEKA
jgi:hypothetical protein